MHLLLGLQKILLDIDKAIRLIRETEEEREVVPNLMIGFGIDELQAEYVAEIRLRNINREYILKRTDEIKSLEDEIHDLEDILDKPRRIKNIIVDELKSTDKKYGAPRRTAVIYNDDMPAEDGDDGAEDYPVNIFMSREGYFKKITPQSLRMSGEQKYKESDGEFIAFTATNRSELLIFTDKQQCYKCRASDFEDTKASVLGTYLPSFLKMDDGESVIYLAAPGDYSGSVFFFFDNGKAARVEMSSYATKTNRRKLTGAYSDRAPVVSILAAREECDVAAFSSDGRAAVFNTSLLASKATRSTQGVQAVTLRRNTTVTRVCPVAATTIRNVSRYRLRVIPASGARLAEEDSAQIKLEIDE
jgi:DNA gyrase subunit A